MRKPILILCAAAVGIIAMGCHNDGNNSQAVSAVNAKTAADLNSSRSAFEKSEDPPLTADTHFAAGQLNESQGAIPTAIKQYDETLKLDPKYAPALFRLGVLYSELKQYPQAIGMWNRYITVTNHSSVGYSNLAYCQELAGDPKAAEISYRTGIERDPKSQPCHINYGLMLARTGRIDEAKAQFSAVLKPAEVHYNLASVYELQGKKDLARAEYAEAIKADPKFIDAQAKLAQLDKD
jgi:tetratricopeptide (TPR) repeat protein